MLAHAGSFITPSDYKHVGQGVKCQRDAKSKEIWGKQVRQMNWTSPASILFGNTRMESITNIPAANSGNFLNTVAGFGV